MKGGENFLTSCVMDSCVDGDRIESHTSQNVLLIAVTVSCRLLLLLFYFYE
jgi:hypothetical protein